MNLLSFCWHLRRPVGIACDIGGIPLWVVLSDRRGLLLSRGMNLYRGVEMTSSASQCGGVRLDPLPFAICARMSKEEFMRMLKLVRPLRLDFARGVSEGRGVGGGGAGDWRLTVQAGCGGQGQRISRDQCVSLLPVL